MDHKTTVLIGDFIVSNDKGIHTRPATELVRCASLFKSEIFLSYRKMRVNAKSILGILLLAASRGAKVKIEADGPDAQEAIDRLIALAANNFNIEY